MISNEADLESGTIGPFELISGSNEKAKQEDIDGKQNFKHFASVVRVVVVNFY